jgi:hypothetical protein
MTFAGWCEYRADVARRELRVTWAVLMRRRIVREQHLYAELAYEQVADTMPDPPAPVEIPAARQCVNHPGKWAQGGGLCRACLRAAGDQRPVREIQTARAIRAKRRRQARLPVYGK